MEYWWPVCHRILFVQATRTLIIIAERSLLSFHTSSAPSTRSCYIYLGLSTSSPSLLVCPIYFSVTLISAYQVVVWALYPESNQRTLEEMDLLFASDSPWVWNAEANFKLLKEQNPSMIGAFNKGRELDAEDKAAAIYVDRP